MTVKQLLDSKYENWLMNMTAKQWDNIKYYAEAEKMRIPEYMYMCLEITQSDIIANGGYAGELYAELRKMHKNKLLASNIHRNEHGHVNKWWLTKKGLRTYKDEI